MRRLLLITGDLATGKTTFADRLAVKYEVNVFHKDTIKEVLGDNIGFSNREENLILSRTTIELMVFLFEEFAKLNKDVILEANFHETELNRFQEIARKNGYQILTVVFRGEIETLHKRYCYRMEYENRHPVHLSTTMDRFADFKDYIEKSRKEKIPGEVVHVDATDFSYQTQECLLGRIDRFFVGE